jgi:hypothetical protein
MSRDQMEAQAALDKRREELQKVYRAAHAALEKTLRSKDGLKGMHLKLGQYFFFMKNPDGDEF